MSYLENPIKEMNKNVEKKIPSFLVQMTRFSDKRKKIKLLILRLFSIIIKYKYFADNIKKENINIS